MSKVVTLMDTMSEIRENIRNKRLTESMLQNSLRYNPEGYRAYLQSQHLASSQQPVASSQVDAEKIEELEQSQYFTQQTLEALVSHINKHLSKLSDAVIILQRDVEDLKRKQASRDQSHKCCCDCEYGEEEEDECECCCGNCYQQ